MSESKTDWIAVDWGTSNVRAWGIGPTGKIAFSAQSDQGMGRLKSSDYAGILNGLLEPHVKEESVLDVVICGMAGAKQGWREAPYLETPADLRRLGERAISVDALKSTFNVRILSGVCHNVTGAEDVMRGEETQLLGLLAMMPDFEGVVCMPGTHSKWARIEGGRLTEFSTSMTGELFEVLRVHSVLRHSMPEQIVGDETEDGIADGLDAGLAAPHRLTSTLFRTRAASLLSGKSPQWCAGFLSGLLVGAEVAGHKDRIGGASIPLVGSARLCRLYSHALEKLGVASEPVDATRATIAGLSEARRHLR